MKKFIGKIIFLVVVFIPLIFISCPNQMNSSLIENDNNDISSESYVYSDPSRGMAVFVDELGIETLIQSDEEDGAVVCAEVIDFISMNNSRFSARSASQGSEYAKAFILGKRSDGFPGLWIVFSSGRVTPVINSDNINTSELLNIVEFRQPLSRFFGWTYEALEMIISDDGDEIIISGYAENKNGINSWFYNLDPGTTIGVYWSVIRDVNGLYHISRAKVLGLKDRSWWSDFRKNIHKSDYRHRYRWMWALRMFFSGWYDRYITMPDGLDFGDSDGEYRIGGIDQDGDDAFAIVTSRKVLSVEKEPETNDNQAPYAVIGPAAVSMDAGSGSAQSVILITDSPGTELDPDIGDYAFFACDPLPDYATLDSENGIITVVNADWNNGNNYDLIITVWIEDEHGLTSPRYDLTIHFGS